MSKRVIDKCLCLVACSVITACAGTAVLAENAEVEAVAEETAAEAMAAREIVFILQGNEISIENQTADQADTSVVEAEEGAAEAKVIITLADGSEHMFENVKADILDGAVFTEDHGFYYLTAKDTDGSNTEFTETAEPVPAKGDQSMWVTTDVNIREEADSDAAIVTVASIGGECKVISFLPGWVQV
ncbi:MAG: hypothetical protein HUJ72_00025, partial [Blautia sp.]|nr:hypothetical protein [Blautia sp.]